ncbi:hypothetical protein D1816_12880 [Aquimarina sp. AD10]|uniref:hypothetical protein n=1 Tax=Aquimarina sp. AD10 TaxID=1714849 RepID=UPI000E504C16|nr:hypothetical protein [Aquimarina sp. AD10]AXT61202.1 hypothetical protein D1816_12880 [Aquimarina sp. AD10]RKN02182.1 hypothetical protein D7033_01730 [Aquimarina sp. AD10]
MKYILLLLLFLNTILYSQNKDLIKETFYAQSVNNLDKIASENGYKRKEKIFLHVNFKCDSIGKIYDIKVSDESKIFEEEIKFFIKQIPKLNPKEYNRKGNVMKYSLKMGLRTTTKSEYKKIIAKNEKIDINYKWFTIKEYFPLKTIEISEVDESDFSIVEHVPVTENCKNLTDKVEIKQCVSKELKMHVNRKFNTELAANLPYGVHKVIVNFYISKEGEIVNISAEGGTPELIEEGIRAINTFPSFYKGGQINGEFVNVKYSLPIMFSIN